MFDILTTGAVVDELRRTILDGRIQRIGMVDALTVAMEIYADRRRHYLVASADAENPRVYLVPSMPATDPQIITPFSLQLRKYVRGGFIVDINQPPLERIVTLAIARRIGPADEEESSDESGNEDDIWSGDNISRLDLAIEIMGRHSNLILVQDDGLVRESAKRVTAHMSRVRQILPKYAYSLPPAPNKPDPRQITGATMQQVLANARPADSLATALVRSFRSVSPIIGREVAWRTQGTVDISTSELPTDAAAEIARVLRAMYQPLLTNAWQPRAYQQDGLAFEYAPVPMEHLASDSEEIVVENISTAIGRVDSNVGTATPQDHAQRRARLIQAIDRALESQQSRLHSLQEQHARVHDTDRLRRWGDAIYAWLWKITPEDTVLVVETEVGEERIPLVVGQDARETAAQYFEQYRKGQKAGAQLPEKIAAVEAEIAYFQQLRWQTHEAAGFAGIEEIRREFEDHVPGHAEEKSGKPRKRPPSDAGRVSPFTDDDGNLYYLGRNNRQNEQVTFKIASAHDWWLHARGVPGSHVILRTRLPADEPPDVVMQKAASLAAWYSQGRASGDVEVDIARRRDVKKIRGAGPGMVTYRNERTILVPARSEAELNLE